MEKIIILMCRIDPYLVTKKTQFVSGSEWSKIMTKTGFSYSQISNKYDKFQNRYENV